MDSRDKRIDSEAAALWQALYGEPPAGRSGDDMLQLALQRLPDVSYQRLSSPYLRRTEMSWPKGR
jgi:hypothetical protein